MKFISLFTGIGGFDLALDRLGHQCLYANDIDKYCKITYDKHFDTKLTLSDIRTIKASDIPDHDLLVGGFPCQSFSVAGKRGGFADTRGTLFFEIARILKERQPRLFILENVKGLLSHDQGKTFTIIISTLDELGYDLQWQVLNSKNFGVPQNRERVFIVGHIRGTPGPKVFSFGQGDSINDSVQSKKGTEGSRASCLNTRYGQRWTDESYIKQINNPVHSNDRVYAEDGISPTLNTMQGGRRQPKVMRQPLKFLQRNQKNIEGDYAFTVDGANTGGIRQDMRIRRLTPIECERLQGFPDNWTVGVSDTQRYKQLGNRVKCLITLKGLRL
jgi:DNA (cytosine-5)-methyltransferase 1